MIIILSYIIFLYMTLFKVVASSSEEKVPDFSEQCSRRISLVVGAYWNPWPTLIFRHSRLMSSLSPTESSFIGRKPALYVSIFFINFAKQVKWHHKKKCTYIHKSTGGDTATASANYCGPKTQIAKKCKNSILSKDNRCCSVLNYGQRYRSSI